MLYEVHVTVEQGKEKPKIFGAKTINLELSSGAHRFQTLVGARGEFDSLVKAKEWMKFLEDDLQSRGFPGIRTKLESILTNKQTEYKEGHWKFEGQDIKHIFRVIDYAKAFGYLVSWSSDRNNVFWLTKRFYGDAKYANSFFSNCDVNMRAELSIFHQGKVHFEDVILDTNLDLDNGWNPA